MDRPHHIQYGLYSTVFSQTVFSVGFQWTTTDRTVPYIRYPLIYEGYFIFIWLYVSLPIGVKAGDLKAHPTYPID